MVVQIQDGEVSISTIQDIVLLKSNDPSFMLFQGVVDNTIKEAIVEMYGEFSEFTTPIITKSMLRDMENTFQQMLPNQYHTYRTLIGKPVKLFRQKPFDQKQRRKEQVWDCYAFFEFIHHTRTRNSHYFIWFAVVNSAVLYGGTRSHIATHFGYNTPQQVNK